MVTKRATMPHRSVGYRIGFTAVGSILVCPVKSRQDDDDKSVSDLTDGY